VVVRLNNQAWINKRKMPFQNWEQPEKATLRELISIRYEFTTIFSKSAGSLQKLYSHYFHAYNSILIGARSQENSGRGVRWRIWSAAGIKEKWWLHSRWWGLWVSWQRRRDLGGRWIQSWWRQKEKKEISSSRCNNCLCSLT
jgi:hypothetical protein